MLAESLNNLKSQENMITRLTESDLKMNYNYNTDSPYIHCLRDIMEKKFHDVVKCDWRLVGETFLKQGIYQSFSYYVDIFPTINFHKKRILKNSQQGKIRKCSIFSGLNFSTKIEEKQRKGSRCVVRSKPTKNTPILW